MGNKGLLVLSRCVDDLVTITCPDGTEITVMVLEVRRGKVRLGFKAPKEYQIMRDELLDKEKKE